MVDGAPAAVTFIETDREGSRLQQRHGHAPRVSCAEVSLRSPSAPRCQRAAAHGVTRVYTGNDVTNAPMQAINRRLGYAPHSTVLNWAKNRRQLR